VPLPYTQRLFQPISHSIFLIPITQTHFTNLVTNIISFHLSFSFCNNLGTYHILLCYMKERGMQGWLLINNLKHSTRWNKRNTEDRHSGHKLLKEFEKEKREEYLNRLFLPFVIAPISHYPCPFFSLFSSFTQFSASSWRKRFISCHNSVSVVTSTILKCFVTS